jgi:adenine-specific DNA-methyltransferase
MNLALIDDIRMEANTRLDPINKAILGQYMTPASVAQLMASMLNFRNDGNEANLLDCGAGVGTLTIAAVNAIKNIQFVEQWEIDPIMRNYLESNTKSLGIDYTIYSNDFIEDAVENILEGTGSRFTHAILNPPYKKINSNSAHRKLLRSVGIETVNLYTAFLALTILLMKDGGRIVAIIPRSFCNGTYYKPFREMLLQHCSIEWLHLFESRVSTFKDDSVLQENIIISLVKNKPISMVMLSTSKEGDLDNLKVVTFKPSEIVQDNDPEKFIRFPTSDLYFEDNQLFQHSLSELGVQVSTGPIVDFRERPLLIKDVTETSLPIVPMPYPHHFVNGEVIYPREHKKYPNAILQVDKLKKSLWPAGYYVLIKRFSSKEELRRIVAYLVTPSSFKSELLAFENGWNVLHIQKSGLSAELATGLTCFLNSSEVDNYFRIFSGHTQVNATDLRNMRFPSLDALSRMGRMFRPGMMQSKIDAIVEGFK